MPSASFSSVRATAWSTCHPRSTKPRRPPPNVDHFCLGIVATDMDAVVAYLGEHGVEAIGEPSPRYGARGTGLSIYVRDPEGNVVELKQIPDASTRLS